MRITILACGTRGDVQPFVALGLGLEARGHHVVIAANQNLRDFVRSFGLACVPVNVDSQAILSSERGQELLASGNVGAFTRHMLAILHEHRAVIQRDCMLACENADAIIATGLTHKEGICLSESLGVPLLLGNTFPAWPATRELANLLVAPGGLPFKWLNAPSHALFQALAWKSARASYAEWRQALGLKPIEMPSFKWLAARRVPNLHHFSEHVVPRPRDWSREQHVTGYLTLHAGARGPTPEAAPDAALVEWLKAGSPPMFFGFGSMPIADPLSSVLIAAEAARTQGRRTLVGAGWSQFPPGSLPDDVFLVGAVDHEWLFPQCAAVVHHGGAGTTAASLRAGVPTVVCSVFCDQPFWGERVKALGLGDHLPFKQLAKRPLARALATASRASVSSQAQEMGLKLRAENGVAVAIAVIEATVERRQRVAALEASLPD